MNTKITFLKKIYLLRDFTLITKEQVFSAKCCFDENLAPCFTVTKRMEKAEKGKKFTLFKRIKL